MLCCGVPYAGRFKLGILGVVVSLMLFIAGTAEPFRRQLIPIPLLWAVGFILLLASLTLYYDVKERFWAEVEKKSKEGPPVSSA